MSTPISATWVWFCYDLDGKEVWSHKEKPHKMRMGWGTAASPALHGDRLYIVNDNEEQSYLLALDKKTGEEIWKVERDEKSNWATPFIWKNAERTEIVTAGTNRVRSYDLDGKLLWELGGMSCWRFRRRSPGRISSMSRRAMSWTHCTSRCSPSGPARPATSASKRTRQVTNGSPGVRSRPARTTRRRSITTTMFTCCTIAACWRVSRRRRARWSTRRNGSVHRRSPRRRGQRTARYTV